MSVYFLAQGRLVKIGKSSNPIERVKSLQTGAFLRLRLLAVAEITSDAQSYEIERRLHEQFSWSRKRGEFFAVTRPLNDLIAAVASGMSVVDAMALTANECRRLANKVGRLDGCKAITPPVVENSARRRKRLRTEARTASG